MGVWVNLNMALFAILILTGTSRALSTRFGVWVPFVFVAIVWIGSLGFLSHARRIRRRANEWDGKMCKHCGYDLRQTEEPGPCPECGKAFEVEGLRAYWESGLKK